MPRPDGIQMLQHEAEADLKADPRLSTVLKWAFWHAAAVGKREALRDRAWRVRMANPTDDALAGALDGLLEEAITYETACAHVLEMLRARRPKKQAQQQPAASRPMKAA